jgi:hypothetical protein
MPELARWTLPWTAFRVVDEYVAGAVCSQPAARRVVWVRRDMAVRDDGGRPRWSRDARSGERR